MGNPSESDLQQQEMGWAKDGIGAGPGPGPGLGLGVRQSLPQTTGTEQQPHATETERLGPCPDRASGQRQVKPASSDEYWDQRRAKRRQQRNDSQRRYAAKNRAMYREKNREYRAERRGAAVTGMHGQQQEPGGGGDVDILGRFPMRALLAPGMLTPGTLPSQMPPPDSWGGPQPVSGLGQVHAPVTMCFPVRHRIDAGKSV